MKKIVIPAEVGCLAKGHFLSMMETLCHNRGVAFVAKKHGGIFTQLYTLTLEGKEQDVDRVLYLLKKYQEGSQDAI